ncbi:MAG: FHA domain-containing protein [Chitinivibrionales bacterium]|nr:FHA domain-containing protein [Chitinivibrionales bacterium]MBD3357483.1 FHA domain-containing protein [Chitinivibrionales bacterium]
MPIFQLERNDRILGNHVLDTDVVTIGRARDNIIAIANSAVSRYHARIEAADDGYVLTDLGSLNGTYVNGERVKRVLLADGDRIEIGEYAIVFQENTKPAHSSFMPTRNAPSASDNDDKIRDGTETRAMHEKSIISDTAGGDSKHIEVLREPLESAVHQVENDPSTIILKLQGVVDSTNTKILIDLFDDIIDNGPYNVVVDLAEVAAISSTGWGTLLGQQSRLAELECGMKLAGLHEELRERFRMLPFGGLFSCYPTADDAATAFRTDIFTETHSPNEQEYDLRPNKVPNEAPRTVLLNAVSSDDDSDGDKNSVHGGTTKDSMSLEDKIRCVVSERPFQSEHDIRTRLREEEYGRTEVGRFKLKALLKKLDLHTKLKRYQFFLRY